MFGQNNYVMQFDNHLYVLDLWNLLVVNNMPISRSIAHVENLYLNIIPRVSSVMMFVSYSCTDGRKGSPG